MLSLWTSTIRWLAKHCISMVKLLMYTNRQLKKSQPSQLPLVDAVVDVTTAEAVVATITTKVDADVADAIKELTIDNFKNSQSSTPRAKPLLNFFLPKQISISS